MKTQHKKPSDKAVSALAKARSAYETQDFKTAEKHCKTALKAMPEAAPVRNMMALIQINQKKWPAAETSLRRVLKTDPQDGMAWKNLAMALEAQGKAADAEEAYLNAAEFAQDKAAAWLGLGLMYHQTGRPEDALSAYRKAAENGDGIEALYNIGLIELDRRAYEAAAEIFLDVLRRKDDHHPSMANLSIALKAMGRDEEAVQMGIQALAHDPDSNLNQCVFVAALKNLSFSKPDEGAYQSLHYCLTRNGVSFYDAFAAWRSFVQIMPQHSGFMALMTVPDEAAFAGLFHTLHGSGVLAGILDDSFLCLGLRHLVIVDPQIEVGLGRLRACLLRICMADGAGVLAPYGAFLGAFGEYMFFNEYVPQMSAVESAVLPALYETCGRGAAGPETAYAHLMAACYGPLSQMTDAPRLRGVSAELDALLTMTIDEPGRERALAAKIPALSDIRDDVSQKVRQMYEENPYPRWRSLSLYGTDPAQALAAEREILVAGCGTGRQSLAIAVNARKAHVTALDLSLASLGYAARKTDEYGVRNISFVHGDILEAGRLGRMFDRVECAGVLHHMEDPMAGWRVLTDLLKPGGTMRIGLYSELARRSVVNMRDIIARQGFAAELEGIRKARQYVFESGDEGVQELLIFRDFYTASMCRDLVFHVQEHRFTLPQIKTCIETLGLEMLGMEMDFAHHRLGYVAQYPDDPDCRNFESLDAFEHAHPDMYRGMYKFELRKPD